MLKPGRILALAATVAPVNSIFNTPSQASLIGGPAGLPLTIDVAPPIEDAQFAWGGRRYCWYFDGWRGPGWYWCGYHWRRGFGWGGPSGWHGWRHPPRRPGVRPPGMHRPPVNRPGVNRPGGNRPSVNRPGGNRRGVNRPGGNRPGGGGRPGGGRPG